MYIQYWLAYKQQLTFWTNANSVKKKNYLRLPAAEYKMMHDVHFHTTLVNDAMETGGEVGPPSYTATVQSSELKIDL